ncbi:MAG: hypothetical protein RMY62_018555 [Nostoc sp. ZfuVER08]|jgi:hypothetical protein|uniref:Uncharacterized protein n=1 Tax=Nostoc punctiforme FACHB-252 TaxID=1357509 RepID=A0ABR8H4V9_NOSPU|nr:hypothetical protein [Nostoc punctiforme]MBD2610886.1 hypothetical protein [Nostoc punctiforme FACHB-252]MBL1200769.1 hypothetical protein [Nostoc sp. GBBB01]MDZ8015451.1 hypothetical protein [Nostoc sp. ZfuVER08]
MFRPPWLQFLINLGLEFWLPIPLIGLFFWLSTGLLTHQVLSYTYDTNTQIHADSKHQIQFSVSVAVMSIEAVIQRKEKLTEVKVYTADSFLKQMEFEFPVTEFAQIDAAIAQNLRLPVTAIKQVIRYRIEN